MKIEPTEIRCLVELEEVSNKSAGGIILPDSVKDSKRLGQTKATLLSVGGSAFYEWGHPVPEVGDTVLLNKYEAEPVSGEKDERLCLVNDQAIGAIIDRGGA